MTWRKGFFRLWAALSIVWIVGMGYAMNLHVDMPRFFRLYGIISTLEDHIAAKKPFENGEGKIFTVMEMERDLPPLRETMDLVKTSMTNSLWAALTPPAVGLVLLWLLAWVARGFRSAKT